MRELEQGMYARSLAGHDKGKLYVVIEADPDYVYLADGRIRTLDHCKKKKRKHVQPDYQIAEVLRDRHTENKEIRDEDIRKAIKAKED